MPSANTAPVPQTTVGITPESTAEPTRLEVAQSAKFFGYAVSPNKQIIAVSRLDGIHLFDSVTLEEIRFIEREIKISSGYAGKLPVAFSPDGDHLAFSDGFGVSVVNLLSNGNETESYVVSLIPSFEITEIAINSDNTHMILYTRGSYTPCGEPGGNFALYDTKDTSWQLVIDRYFCDGPSASLFRFTETGRAYFFFWYTTLPYPYSMDVVDLSTNALIENVNFKDIGYAPEKTFYDISPNGKIIASVEYNGDGLPLTTRLIDVETGVVVDTTEGPITFASYPSNGGPLWVNEWGGKWVEEPAPCETTAQGYMISYKKVVSQGDLSTYLVLSFNDLKRAELWNTSQCEQVKVIGESK